MEKENPVDSVYRDRPRANMNIYIGTELREEIEEIGKEQFGPRASYSKMFRWVLRHGLRRIRARKKKGKKV